MSSHLEAATTLLQNIMYVTIATTSTDGQPWNTPVFTAHDKQLSFYWISNPNSVHSRNIAGNKKVFAVLYDSLAPAGTGQGVYMQATAEAIDDLETATHARTLLSARQNKTPRDAQEFIGNNATRRLYKLTPTAMWVNDVEITKKGRFVRDLRIPLDLAELRSAIV